MKRASYWLVVSLILFCLPFWAQEQKKPEPPKAVDFTWGVKIPMRDGVKLNATVYRPKDQKEALPVIFELTPYISDSITIAPTTSRNTVMYLPLLMCAAGEIPKATLIH